MRAVPFRIGERARDRQDATPGPVVVDRPSDLKLRRGKRVPEARIDLHGMTVSQAHPALTEFVLRAHAKGLRLVLVITGKGGRADDRAVDGRGILRRQVPVWLRTGPVSQIVAEVSEAHQRHGGGGALYVRLRRRA